MNNARTAPDASESLRSIAGCATLGMIIDQHATPPGASIASTLAATQDSDGRMARGAMLVLADQALATGVHAAFGSDQAMMTLDLRVDWLAPPPPGATVTARIDRVIRHGKIVAVQGELVANGAGASLLVATACGRFLTGSFPGGGDFAQGTAHAAAPVSAAADFATLLALRPGHDEAVMPPNPALVGSPMLPAVHGGFIAAALEAASAALAPADKGWSPVDVEIRYIRPALATVPLHIVPRVLRSSRRTVIIDAHALQGEDRKIVASARMLFFRGDESAADVETVRFAGGLD